MRIAVIATSGIYPIHVGGPGNVGYYLSKEFGNLGHSVTVFIRVKNKTQLDRVKRMSEFNSLNNVEFVPISIEYNMKTFFNIPLIIIKIINISSVFLKYKFDIILYNSPPVDVCVLIPFISRIKGYRQFIIFHGYGGLVDNRNIIGRSLIKAIKCFFEKSIVVSKHSRSLPSLFGIPNNKICIIYNGVEIKEECSKKAISCLPGHPRILYVGTLSKLKCVDKLIMAFSLFLRKYPNSILFIVGDGSELEDLIKLATNLGVIRHVHFEGFISGNKVNFYYKNSDLFVLPSTREGLPISLLESMAFSLPIIVSDSDLGPKELFENGAKGLIFKSNDHFSLYQCMLQYFSMSEYERISMSRFNVEYILRHHNWKSIAFEYLKLFEREHLD